MRERDTVDGRVEELIDPGRARFVRGALGAAAAIAMTGGSRAGPGGPGAAPTAAGPMQTRSIPSSRESLPAIGCGTWIGFDVRDDDAAAQQELGGVVDALFAAGGRVLDSSPMYGRSEAVTGRLLAAVDSVRPPGAFVATKVWTSGRDAGIEQMRTSIRLLGRVDLMQVHNLLDWRTHLPTLRQWKAEGRIRYIGVTHYTSGAYRELAAVLRAEPIDFVQLDYALDDREAEERILPLAADRGIAVLVNRPFGGGGLLRRLSARPLPDWAGEIGAATWSQVLLKFVLAHPAVTCAIPGTGNARHMAENAAAGSGAIPDRAFWARRAEALVG